MVPLRCLYVTYCITVNKNQENLCTCMCLPAYYNYRQALFTQPNRWSEHFDLWCTDLFNVDFITLWNIAPMNYPFFEGT